MPVASAAPASRASARSRAAPATSAPARPSRQPTAAATAKLAPARKAPSAQQAAAPPACPSSASTSTAARAASRLAAAGCSQPTASSSSRTPATTAPSAEVAVQLHPLQVRASALDSTAAAAQEEGRRLYSERKYQDAIPLFEQAAGAFAEAEALLKQCRPELSESALAKLNSDRLKQHDNNVRRLDVLAACYRMMGQFSLYISTTHRALQAIPSQHVDGLSRAVGSAGPGDVFAAREWNRVAAMVRNLLDLAFFGQQAGLGPPTLRGPSADDTAPSDQGSPLPAFDIGADAGAGSARLCKAAALEHYISSSLDLNLHRENGPSTYATVVDACLGIYKRNQFPVRHARTAMRRIELQLLKPSIQLSGAALLRDVEDILSLLEGSIYEDAQLKHLTPQYMANAYLLRASVLQHCSPQPGDGSLDIIECVERATLLLQKVIDSAEDANSNTARRARPSLELTSRANTAAPVTPPRQSKSSLIADSKGAALSRPNLDENASTKATTTETGPFDDPARLCALLESTSEMMSAFGHGLAALKLLRTLRRIHQLDTVQGRLNRSDYYRCCAALASQYITLGQVPRAKDVLADAQRVLKGRETVTGPTSAAKLLSPDAQVRCLLAEAALFCALGDPQTASISYEQAISIADDIRPQQHQRLRWQNGLNQFQLIERRALASSTCSIVRLAHGDLDGAIVASILCCRQWYKLSNLLGKLFSVPSSSAKSSATSPSERGTSSGAIPGIENPFGPEPGAEKQESPPPKTDKGDAAKPTEEKVANGKPALQHFKRQLPAQSLIAVYWRCGRQLLEVMIRCSQLLLKRGSGRDAELYATEAVDTAESLNTAISLSRALLQRADVRLLLGRVEDGNADLMRARDLLQEAWTPEASESARISGEALLRARDAAKAVQSFEAGQAALERLNALYSDVETITPSPMVKRTMASKVGADGRVRGGSVAPVSTRALLPNTQASLLIRQAQAMLLEGDRAASASLLERALLLQTSQDIHAHSKSVLGQIALQHALRSLTKDQVLSSLTDAVVTAPMISPSSKTLPASGAKAVIKALHSAYASFSEAISSGALISDAPLLREAAASQALVAALLHSLEIGSKTSTQRADGALLADFGSSITVLREYMGAIGGKLSWSDFTIQEPKWLQIEHARAAAAPQKGMAVFSSQPDELDAFWAKTYAAGIQYSAGADEVQLPPNWTVVNISFVKARNALVITRQGGGQRPVAVHLPVDRMSRREGEDEHLSVEAASQQMAALTETINAGVHGAKDVESREGKMQWWEERRRLDQELQELMTTIETNWLGAFKTVLAEPSRASDEHLSNLRDKLAGVLKHACAPNAKVGVKIKLDRVIIECIARLRPGMTTDEDLEDLIHFMMDALQVGGAPVAVDEVDVDDCVVAVRTTLEEFWSRQSKATSDGLRKPDDDHHLFLVLDKDACAFPWESLAMLRDRPVSRIPSIRFLQDRINMAPLFCPQVLDAANTGHFYELDNPRTFWLLNPSGDLKRTQARLTPWLAKQQKHSSWRGITGRMPIVDELPRALEENDVFTYFGHGGAEQYIRASRIRKMKRCAVTMLWGCSSGYLQDQGELDRAGTPLNYMLAGAPALVANLWDMTDIELDRVCETVFCKVGMMQPEDRGSKSLIAGSGTGSGPGSDLESSSGASLSGAGRSMSLPRAVAEARRDCRLPYLSGGGCVTYGVPVYFKTA
ncbi:separin protein [Tilletia horrida]|nr:separin protein [Tilletia horrida]